MSVDTSLCLSIVTCQNILEVKCISACTFGFIQSRASASPDWNGSASLRLYKPVIFRYVQTLSSIIKILLSMFSYQKLIPGLPPSPSKTENTWEWGHRRRFDFQGKVLLLHRPVIKLYLASFTTHSGQSIYWETLSSSRVVKYYPLRGRKKVLHKEI